MIVINDILNTISDIVNSIRLPANSASASALVTRASDSR